MSDLDSSLNSENSCTLSLAVCTFNRLNYIKLLMHSLENCQRIEEVKLMIIDNSDEDDTQRFFDLNTFKHVKVFYKRIPANGLSFARNIAISECPTTHILFIDDDCLIPSNFIDKILIHLHKKNIEAFTGVVNHLYPLRLKNAIPPEFVTVNPPSTGFHYLPGNFMGFKVSIFEGVGGFDEKLGKNSGKQFYGEDTLLEFELKRKNIPITYFDNVNLFHFQLEMTHAKWKEMHQNKAFSKMQIYAHLNYPTGKMIRELIYHAKWTILLFFRHISNPSNLRTQLRFQFFSSRFKGVFNYLIS